MGILLCLIGSVVLFYAFITSSSADTSIHQIYYQLVYITGAVFFCGGVITQAINNFADEFWKYRKSQTEKENIN